MYQDFYAADRWTKKQVHCIYQALIVAIATRHADAVDIKFLVDGRPVWVALPHPAWVEYKKRTGRSITDPLAIEIAGHYLKTALESGEGVGREMYSLTVEQTLAHLDAVVAEIEAAQPGTHEISPAFRCDVCHLELSYRMGDNRKPVLRVPSRQRLVYLALLFVGPS